MQRHIALSWIFPAAMILLLHTLVPHSHDFISTDSYQSCNHQEHRVWEFVEHLLEQNSGENHLESFQVELENKLELENISLYSIIIPQFSTKEITLLKKVGIVKPNDILINPFFSNSLSYRGPPLS